MAIPANSEVSSSSLPTAGSINDSISYESSIRPFVVPIVLPVADRRASTRQSKPPVWLKDHSTSKSKSNSVCLYIMSNHDSHDNLSITHSAALDASSSVYEPSSFEEASLDPKWIEAMKSDVSTIEENNTWSTIDLPPGKHPIGCK